MRTRRVIQPHFKQLFAEKGNYADSFGMADPKKEWGGAGAEGANKATDAGEGGGVKALLIRFSGSVSSSKCTCCGKTAYPTEAVDVDGVKYHKTCFKCVTCGVSLTLSTFSTAEGKLYCRRDVPKAVAKAGLQTVALVKQLEAQKLTSDAVGSPDIVARYATRDAAAQPPSSKDTAAAAAAAITAAAPPVPVSPCPVSSAEVSSPSPAPAEEEAVKEKAAVAAALEREDGAEAPPGGASAPAEAELAPAAPETPAPEAEAEENASPAPALAAEPADALDSSVDADVLGEANNVAQAIDTGEDREEEVEDILSEAKALGDDIEKEVSAKTESGSEK